MNAQDIVHQIIKAKRRIYSSMIEHAKRTHWEGFLASLDDRSVWTDYRYISGKPKDGSRVQVLTLRAKQVDGSIRIEHG